MKSDCTKVTSMKYRSRKHGPASQNMRKTAQNSLMNTFLYVFVYFDCKITSFVIMLVSYDQKSLTQNLCGNEVHMKISLTVCFC